MKRKHLVLTAVMTIVLACSACGSSNNDASSGTYETPEGKTKATAVDAGDKAKTDEAKKADTDEKVESLSAEDGAQAKNEITGYYKITKMISDGEDLADELSQLEEMGTGMFLIVNDDGTGFVNMMGDITELDWDEKYFHMHDPESTDTDVPYTFSGDTIELAQEGSEMTFIRMTDEEKLAYKNGDSNKSIDQITDEMLDSALSDATESLDDIYNDATDSIGSAAAEASDEIEKAKSEVGGQIEEAEKELGGEIEKAANEAIDEIGKAGDEALNSLSGSLSGSTSKSGPSTDSSYLPDLSASKHSDSGYYEIMAFQENGTTYSSDALKKAGVQFDMMLCPDGTGYGNFIGTYYDLSWDDGTIYVMTDEGQEKMTYFAQEYDGQKIISISDSSMVMVFKYVKEADDTYEWAGGSGLKK